MSESNLSPESRHENTAQEERYLIQLNPIAGQTKEAIASVVTEEMPANWISIIHEGKREHGVYFECGGTELLPYLERMQQQFGDRITIGRIEKLEESQRRGPHFHPNSFARTESRNAW